jgi:hypothetical protein
MRTAVLFLSCVIPAFAQAPADSQQPFDLAERLIVRLSPDAFPELPAGVLHELQRRRCTIPQTGLKKQPHNVIKGEFAKPGETDWVVLCSVNGFSSILVFRNSSGNNPAEIAPFEDRIFLQGISPDRIAYSRAIAPVGRDFIMQHFNAYGGPKPPSIDHQGIDDAFLEKASSVWYFDEGKWLKLTGSD